MVFDSMEQKALAYAASRHTELGDSLGFGVDGSVWLLHGKDRNHPWAVKLFRSAKPYERERDCYLRLHELQVESVRGFAAPAYLHHDDGHLAVEMTIVRPPLPSRLCRGASERALRLSRGDVGSLGDGPHGEI